MNNREKSLALMQPYFFPYLGYFSLIAASDIFVVFDNAQYIKGGWINKNRIAGHQKQGWAYINIPTQKFAHENSIKDIRMAEQSDWRSRIFNQQNRLANSS